MTVRHSLLTLLLATARAADPLAEADADFRAGRFAEAAKELTALSLEHPGDPGVLDRLGAARYRAGDFDGAARAWDAAASSGAGADALFNAGNAHYQAGRLEDAVDRFARAAAEAPEHTGAGRNREIVSAEIEARRKVQPPPPPKPDDGPRQDGEGGEGDDPQPQSGNSGGEGQGGGIGGDEQSGQGGQPEDDAGSDGGEERPAEPQEGPGSEAVDPAEAQGSGDPGGPPQPAPSGKPEPGGAMGAAQAERLLESVEEGQPAMSVRGRRSDKPW